MDHNANLLNTVFWEHNVTHCFTKRVALFCFREGGRRVAWFQFEYSTTPLVVAQPLTSKQSPKKLAAIDRLIRNTAVKLGFLFRYVLSNLPYST